jgi:HupE / UreJ protein
MKRFSWILLSPSTLLAHMMSMSTGDVTVAGDRAHYELRMPLYEIAHVKDPERSLFDHIRFSSGGQEARTLNHSCRENAAEGAFHCTADYQFAAPVDKLDVACTFYSVTVPNHVHLLRAESGGKRDQAFFDYSFTKTTLRFIPPGPVEIALTQAAAGAKSAVSGLVQILFLASLVLAARSRRELSALGGMFLAGQIVAAVVVPLTSWQPAPRFVEAAAALTIAYLAVEILMLPHAGSRWLVSGILGMFHGLYFELLLRNTGYGPVWVLTGAALTEAVLLAIFAVVFTRIGRLAAAVKPVQVSASLLLAFGIVWFCIRLAS